MTAFDKGSYKSIEVELSSMRELSRRLRADGERLSSLINKMTEDIRQLGYDWEDDNYAQFLLYYLDRVSWVRYYADFAQNQADWIDKAVPVYEALPGDIQAKVGPILQNVGL